MTDPAQSKVLLRRSSREIGPLGTASRVAGGVAAIVVPLVIWGATWWDWAVGLVGFPLVAVAAGAAVAALDTRTRSADPAPSGRMRWAGALLVVGLVLGSATAVTFVTPVDGTAVWIFVGTSMLLAAAKGYGGCEVLAFPNAISGRRDTVGCLLFAPIDGAEGTGGKVARTWS